MIVDIVWTFEALKTPLEVALYRERENICSLLNDHVKLQANQEQSVQEGDQQKEKQLTDQIERQQEKNDDEAVLDCEVHETESDKCKAAISKATGKSESEVIQMMRRGEIPANMWSAVWLRCSESQKNASRMKQEQTDANAELSKVNEQITQLQQKKKDLEQQVRDLQQSLSKTVVSPQVLNVVETLAIAEQKERKLLKAQLREEKENAVLSIEEIGYFLNAAGISGTTQKLISQAEQDEVTEMSLDEMYQYICENVEMESRLEVQFAIDMVRHNQYPPYDKHREECPVCRNTVTEVLTEYQISLKESEVAKMSSSGLMYLERADIAQLLVTNTNMERLQSMKAIDKIRQNHINFINEQ